MTSKSRHQRLWPHRPHGVSARCQNFPVSKSSPSTTCSTPDTWPICSSTTRCTATSRATSLSTATRMIVNGKKIRLTARADPANLKWAKSVPTSFVESTGFFLTEEVARSTHRPPAPESRAERAFEGRHPMFVYGVNHQTYAGQAIISRGLLHHQLPGAGRQGAERQLGHQARPDDHGARRHRNAEDRRRPSQQGLARRPRYPGEHHPVVSTGAAKAVGVLSGHPGAEQASSPAWRSACRPRCLGRRSDRRAGKPAKYEQICAAMKAAALTR